MSEREYRFGDSVRILAGKHGGRVGTITAIDPRQPSRFQVTFWFTDHWHRQTYKATQVELFRAVQPSED